MVFLASANTHDTADFPMPGHPAQLGRKTLPRLTARKVFPTVSVRVPPTSRVHTYPLLSLLVRGSRGIPMHVKLS